MHDGATSRSLNLLGVPCPLNWARAKAELERMEAGTTLELLTDDPRAARDIPRAAESEGYDVVEITLREDVVRIVIER